MPQLVETSAITEKYQNLLITVGMHDLRYETEAADAIALFCDVKHF